MADTLRIEIDVAGAKKALADLKTSMKTAGDSVVDFAKRGTTAMSKFSAAVSKVKGIENTAIDSIKQMGDAMSGLQGGNIADIRSELKKLSKVNLEKTAASTRKVADGLSKIKPPPGIRKIGTDFEKMGASAGKATEKLRKGKPAVDSLQKSVNQFSKEMLNATGFMAGMGVRVGGLVNAFANMKREAGSTMGAFRALTASIGKLPVAIAAISGSVAAFTAIKSVIISLGAPIIKATQEVVGFRNAIDAIRGAGEGAKALEEVRDIAERTGTSLGSLIQNYKQFEASAASAGLEIKKSQEIFEAFSGALTVLGTTVQQQDLAFRALQQMMSKTTVQMEELKGQLGENLPGAVQLFAEAMGLSTKALEKMLKNGEVLAAEVLPKVAALLNQKFGGALQAALATAGAQMALFGNAVLELLNAIGEGGLGGLFTGFAAGVRAVTGAMKTESIEAFARVMGDLLGFLVGGLLGALGGFVEGLLAVPAALTIAASAITETLAGWLGFEEGAENAKSAVQVFVESITSVTKWVGVFLSSLLLAKVAMIAWAVATKVASVAMIGYAGSVGIAAKAMAALNLVMKLNPFILIASVLFTIGAAFVALSEDTEEARKKSEGLTDAHKQGIEVFEGIRVSIDKAREALAKYPKEATAAAAAINRMAAEMQRAKDAVSVISSNIKDLKLAQKELRIEMSQSKVASQSMIIGLQETATALDKYKAGIDRANQATNALQRESLMSTQEMQKLEGQVQGQIQAWAEGKAAMGEFVETGGSVQNQMRNLNRMLRDNKEAIQEAQAAEKARTNELKKVEEGIKAQIAAEAARKKVIDDYGTSLSTANQKLSDYLQKLGLAKDKANEVALARELSNRTLDEERELVAKAISDKEDLITSLVNEAAAAQRAGEAKVEQLKAENAGKTAIENSIKNSNLLVTSLQKQAGAQIELFIPMVAGNEEMLHGVTASVAAARATKIATNRWNEQVPVTKKLKDGTQAYNDILDGNVEKTGTVAEENKKAEDQMKRNTEVTRQMQEEMKTVGEVSGEIATKIGETTTAWQNFTAPVQEAGTALTSASAAMVTMKTDMPIINEQLILMGPLLPPVTEQFGQLATHATTLKEPLDAIAANFTSITTALTAMAETFPAFVTNVARLGENSAGIDAVATSIAAMVTSIAESHEELASAATALEKLATAAENVATQFGEASEQAKTMLTALETIKAAAEKTTEAFKELRDMAIEALAAATAAASAGGGGEGGTSAGAQREGGISGSAVHTQRVDPGSFDNAPHLAQGISNTSSIPSTVSGGGIPTILHPNEAVIPLSKGRKVEVELKQSASDVFASRMGTINMGNPTRAGASEKDIGNGAFAGGRSRGTSSGTLDGGRELSDAAKSLEKAASDQASIADQLALLGASVPVINVIVPTVPRNEAADRRGPRGISDGVLHDAAFLPGRGPSSINTTSGVSAQQSGRSGPINVNITVHASDVDSFKRSEDQIVRQLSRKIERADRRGG